MKVAVCGKMGSGKSFLAENLEKNYDFTICSFAARMKELCSELFDMKTKDRGLLIKFATKMREIDENVWIRSMLKSIEDTCWDSDIVCDDMRLENEYETLLEKDWILVKIDISEEERLYRLQLKYGKAVKSHLHYTHSITENDVVNYDDSKFSFVLRTPGDFENFYKFVSFEK